MAGPRQGEEAGSTAVLEEETLDLQRMRINLALRARFLLETFIVRNKMEPRRRGNLGNSTFCP